MAIGVFLSGAAFALLFGILYTSKSFLEQSGNGGFGGAPVGDDVQIANSVYTAGLSVGYLLMLVIGVDPDRRGVPPPHDHQHLPHPAPPAGVMLGKVLALVAHRGGVRRR